ncbi:hypothetical protein ACWDR1_29390 [Streptosporangium sandarakinum]
MPGQHRHKLVGVRGAPEELVEKVREKAPDGNLSKLTVDFWRWYVEEAGAELPDRNSRSGHDQGTTDRD